MDDVEDDAELRRGLPVAHTVYGVPQTINTANYVYFLAFDELLKLRSHQRAGGAQKRDMVEMVTGRAYDGACSHIIRGVAQSTPRTGIGFVLERHFDLPDGGGIRADDPWE